MVRALLRVARFLRVTKAFRLLSGLLPGNLDARIRPFRMKLRTRSGEVEDLASELAPAVPPAGLKRTYRHALALLAERQGRQNVGDYLEFGVYVGTSLSCMHEALDEEGLQHVRMFGFDSFEGLPETTVNDETSPHMGWKAGDYHAPLEFTRENLTTKGADWDRVTLVEGWFDETLTPKVLERHAIRKAGVIMVDCDLYSSAKKALEFCAPLIDGEAVILLDDWWPDKLAAHEAGEKRAFEEFLKANRLSATEIESYAPEASKVFLVARDG